MPVTGICVSIYGVFRFDKFDNTVHSHTIILLYWTGIPRLVGWLGFSRSKG